MALHRFRIQSRRLSFIITLLGLFGLIVAQFNLALEFSRVLWMFTGYWLAKPTPSKHAVTSNSGLGH